MVTNDLFGQPLRVAGTLPLFGQNAAPTNWIVRDGAVASVPAEAARRDLAAGTARKASIANLSALLVAESPILESPRRLVRATSDYQLHVDADGYTVTMVGFESVRVTGRGALELKTHLLIGADGESACCLRDFNAACECILANAKCAGPR
jgi:hypothetical protein